MTLEPLLISVGVSIILTLIGVVWSLFTRRVDGIDLRRQTDVQQLHTEIAALKRQTHEDLTSLQDKVETKTTANQERVRAAQQSGDAASEGRHQRVMAVLDLKTEALATRLETKADILAAEDRKQAEQLAELTRKTGEKLAEFSVRVRILESGHRDLQGFMARKYGFAPRGLPREEDPPGEGVGEPEAPAT